jgi:hypothetical protein
LTENLIGELYTSKYIDHCRAEDLVREPWPEDLYKRPHMRFVPNPDEDTDETDSEDEARSSMAVNRRPQEYRIPGLTWHTPAYKGTCNLDGFLSAWVRKARQTHGRFLRFVTHMDTVGATLIRMADHVLVEKEKKDDSYIKKLWLNAVLKSTEETRRLRRNPLRCSGRNPYSIFQHLANHSSIDIINECRCGITYHRDFMIEVDGIEQLKKLADPATQARARMPLCMGCRKLRVLKGLEANDDVWVVAFCYKNILGPKSPNLDQIPRTVQIGDKRFKLEYITYRQSFPWTTITHEMSIHVIRGRWYMYNDSHSPHFQKWRGKNFELWNATLTAVVYFRV